MRAEVENKSTTLADYSEAAFEADLAAGTVDWSKLSDGFDGLEKAGLKGVKAMAMSSAKEVSEMSAELRAYEAGTSTKYKTMAAFDQFEGKIDADILAKIKAITQESIDEIDNTKDTWSEPFNQLKGRIDKLFNATSTDADKKGLLQLASEDSADATEAMAHIITDMEVIEKQVGQAADLTIAQILENDPKLRAKMEDEIKNHVWGY